MAKFDIISTLGDSRLYTLHSHTEFCDGRAQMEAFARKATEDGFTHYGFTPHSPVPIESTCNMHRDKVADYDREFGRIVETYGDKVAFLRSMEIDYLGKHWGPAHDYFYHLDLDYALSSIHYIPSQEGVYVDIDGRFENFQKKMHTHFRNDIRYVVEKFFEQSIMMVEEGNFDIIGHLDKVGHNASHWEPGIEDKHWYKALLMNLLEHVADASLIVEINTKALKEHNRMFPAVNYWQWLVDHNVPLIVNSDAHVPALINAGRPEAYAILDSLRKS